MLKLNAVRRHRLMTFQINVQRSEEAVKDKRPSPLWGNNENELIDGVEGRPSGGFYDDLTYFDYFDYADDKKNGNWYRKAADAEDNRINYRNDDHRQDESVWWVHIFIFCAIFAPFFGRKFSN
jgi:hypothetical protein